MTSRRATVTFRLYPESGRRYVRVHVHPTKAAMREYWRTSEARFNGGTWAGRVAYCTDVRKWFITADGRSRRDPCVAEVNLFASRLGTAVVTHEFFHATVAWGRRIGLDFTRLDAEDSVNHDEERLAYVHGELCRQFVDRAYHVGLYTR